jgi:hypothetical protein
LLKLRPEPGYRYALFSSDILRFSILIIPLQFNLYKSYELPSESLYDHVKEHLLLPSTVFMFATFEGNNPEGSASSRNDIHQCRS